MPASDEPLQRVAYALLGDDRLGDLDDQPVVAEPGLGQRRGDRRRQVLVLQDGGRQVDRDRQRQALGCPAGSLVDGLLQHPRGERVDQPALLGERDELGRRDDPAYGMHPAHQCLDVLDLVAAMLISGW